MTHKVTKPIALDESFRTTEQNPKNIADVLANKLDAIKSAIENGGSGEMEAAFECHYNVTSATDIYNAMQDKKVPFFYQNGVVAQLWKVETNKYTFRTTSTRVVEGENILDIVDYIVNGSVWSTATKTISGGSSSQQAYLAKVESSVNFDTTGLSGMQSIISVNDVPADGVYQLSIFMCIIPKTASATKSDLVFQFTGTSGTGMPNTTFHAVVDDSQTFGQQLSFSTTLNLKAGTNTLKMACGGLNTEYLVFVDDLTVAQLVNGVYHNGDDFDEVHTLTEASDFNNDDGVLVDGATGGTRFMLWQTLANKVLGFIKNLSTTITAFRAGDVIPVDGPSGTAKMTKDDLLKETTQDASKTLELKSDINSKLFPVGNLFLAYYAGKYPSVQDGKTVLIGNASYGTVVLSVPDGVQNVSFNVVGSMNFSRLADKDGNDLGKYSDYVVSGSNNLRAVLPSGCKYVYTACLSWASTEPDIVCLPVDYSIQGQTIAAWPKFTLKQLIANKLYSESEKDLYENLIGKKANYDKITDNHKNEVRNLSKWNANHADTVTLSLLTNYSGTATFTADYDGFSVGIFNVSSNKVKIVLRGTQTLGSSFDVTLICYDSNYVSRNYKLKTISSTSYDEVISFDANYYATNYGTAHFGLLISQGTGQTDTLMISDFFVVDSDSLQSMDEWDNELRKMLLNICDKTQMEAYLERLSDGLKNEVKNLSNWSPNHVSVTLVRRTPNSGTATFTSQYDGFTIGMFDANSSAAKIVLKGTQSQECEFDVTLRVYEQDYTMHSHQLKTISSESFDTVIAFDATSYAVYEDAAHFDLLISQTSGTNTINFELFSVINSDYLQVHSEWDNDLRPMLANICESIENIPVPEPAPFDGIIAGGNGNNYKLQINYLGNLVNVPCIPNKVLFMGNSLLLGIDTNGEHGGAFGMCASSPYKDYAYLVEQAVLDKNPSATFTKLHDAAFEMAESDAAAEQYWTDNAASFTSDLDLIIVQIGDNVNTDTRQAVFAGNFGPLLDKIFTACQNARVICVGAWYNAGRSLATISNVAKKYGCDFVNITSLHTNANEAHVGQVITYYDGMTTVAHDNWISHPGDDGMQAIADAIVEKMQMD